MPGIEIWRSVTTVCANSGAYMTVRQGVLQLNHLEDGFEFNLIRVPPVFCKPIQSTFSCPHQLHHTLRSTSQY